MRGVSKRRQLINLVDEIVDLSSKEEQDRLIEFLKGMLFEIKKADE